MKYSDIDPTNYFVRAPLGIESKYANRKVARDAFKHRIIIASICCFYSEKTSYSVLGGQIKSVGQPTVKNNIIIDLSNTNKRTSVISADCTDLGFVEHYIQQYGKTFVSSRPVVSFKYTRRRCFSKT